MIMGLICIKGAATGGRGWYWLVDDRALVARDVANGQKTTMQDP